MSNNFHAMVTSGSKGSIMGNISQIMACVGQQNVSGKRIGYGYIIFTLPHYTANNNSSNIRGYHSRM